MAFAGVAAGLAAVAGLPLMICILIGILAATACGAVSGWLVTKACIPPFIATLGLMMSVRGLNMVFTEGRAIYFMDYPVFRMLAHGKLFDLIPYPVVYLFIVAIAASYILRRTIFGRYVYAVGSNEEAARLSGINVNKIKLLVYTFCGLLTGIAGIIFGSTTQFRTTFCRC